MAGVKGKSGRKPEARVARFNDLIEKIWTPEKRESRLKLLMKDSESDDFNIRQKSRELLFAYTFGKPTEKHSHLGEDGGPIVIKVVYG